MNEFTKEELEAISDELEGTLYHDLRRKIHSMIDDYCVHEWENIYCTKCGVNRC